MTNLSEDACEADLQELFRPFGPIARVYLAKDKQTNQSKVRVFLKNTGYIYVSVFLTQNTAFFVHRSNSKMR